MKWSSACRRPSDEELFASVARWRGDRELCMMRAERLRAIAAVEGVDFATALLYDSLLRSPRHGPFIQRLDGLPAKGSRAGPATVVIVPGAFYLESPHTGADGRLPREEAARFGCPAESIPLGNFGSLEENAGILAEHLLRRPAGPVVLVSLSKGGADVKVALGRRGAAAVFAQVSWWIDLSGMTSGTPLAGWLLARPLRSLLLRGLLWWKGYQFSVIRELDRSAAGPLSEAVCLPPHMQAIHVLGFPRKRHLSTPLSRRGHQRLSRLGPNDGAVLLGDVTRLPGLIYPIWGADHYLRPAGRDMRALVGRILSYVMNETASPPLAIYGNGGRAKGT